MTPYQRMSNSTLVRLLEINKENQKNRIWEKYGPEFNHFAKKYEIEMQMIEAELKQRKKVMTQFMKKCEQMGRKIHSRSLN